MTRFLLILLFGNFLAAASLASGEDAAAVKAARAVAISAPRPDYPYLARRSRLTGLGVAVLHIDKSTGVVTAAEMSPSTGHAILDNAALSAFRRWRFKPGTVAMVKLPIAFAMGTTIDPNRAYPFSGIVQAVNVRAGTITVKGRTGTDTIAVSPEAQLRKNGQTITLGDIAISDNVSGRAKARPPLFKAVAQSITVKASAR
jgi:TonB family protein